MEDIEAYADHAHALMDNVIDVAIARLQEAVDARGTYLQQQFTRQQTSLSQQEDLELGNISWPSIGEFTEEVGKEKIDEYLQTWERHDSWLYCIDFLRSDDHEFDVRYQYRVRWSIPTRRKPIPRATTCVYFTLSVSKIKPPFYKIDVYYVIETTQLVHKPGKSRFRQKWLKDVIDSKILIMDIIEF